MIIYKITNLINGKIYIGQTITRFGIRINNHRHDIKRIKSPLYNAFKSHGFENFEFLIIDSASSQMELDELEKKWILFYQSNDLKKGYNLESGGKRNYKISDEIREKLSNSHKGLKHSEESKLKISKANKGRKLTEEQLQKMIVSKTGKCPLHMQKRKIKIVCLNNNKFYDSCMDACKELNLSSGNVSSVLNGKISHTKGFIFKRI